MPLTITLLVDNHRSWFGPYAARLRDQLKLRDHTVHLVYTPGSIPLGDIAFFLSCEQIIEACHRRLNTHNVVIHSSALPEGKGWSPLTWQVIEGRNTITNTAFEAEDAVDSGAIYAQSLVALEGHELLDELHEKQGRAIIDLALKFVDDYPPKSPSQQSGPESFHRRRTPRDSELDPHKTIAEQFNLLRVVDNEAYPAFFHHRGHRYTLRITKDATA